MASAGDFDAARQTYYKAFERLKDSVSHDDARLFQSTDLRDVWEAVKAIERELESSGRLRRFRRIEPFLTGLEQYSKVIEVVCNGTPYLPYIWAPVKLMLQISQQNISALEKLIEAYASIAESLPRFDRLSTAFKDDKDFQQILAQFYVVILDFHRRAYKHFRRRGWSVVFESLWKSFDLRFQVILESLRRHRDLIDKEANAIDIAEAKEWRNRQLADIQQWQVTRNEMLEQRERERSSGYIREVVTWIGATSHQEDLYAKSLQAVERQGESWILQHPVMIQWLDPTSSLSSIWLHGKPGGGKSVLCSQIINHIEERTDIPLIFYCCQRQSSAASETSFALTDSGKWTDMLRNFIVQLFKANTELAPYILETFANHGQVPSKKILEKIFERLMGTVSHLRIVVDGLDECSRADQELIVYNLKKIKVSAVTGSCKLLVSSRYIDSTAALFHTFPAIRLEDNADQVHSTIAGYLELQLATLSSRFSSETIHRLRRQILIRANGMFLWVKLVLFSLKHLYFEGDSQEFVDALPKDLGNLYQMLLDQLCGQGSSPRERRAIRLLQWMSITRRPLRKAELEWATALDENNTVLSEANRPKGDVLRLCYPILEVDGGRDSYVSFVHFTAYEFLRDSSTIPNKAQISISISCVLYLKQALSLINPEISKTDQLASVFRGDHELNLYATEYWIDHVEAVALQLKSLHIKGVESKFLCRCIEELTKSHDNLLRVLRPDVRLPDEPDTNTHESRIPWLELDISIAAKSFLEYNRASQESLSPDQGLAGTTNQTDLTGRSLVLAIRSRYLELRDEVTPQAEAVHGQSSEDAASQVDKLFFCRYLKCPLASQGFQLLEVRELHESSHLPVYRCDDAKCGFFGWPFNSRDTIKKHVLDYHNDQAIPAMPSYSSKRRSRKNEERVRFRFKEAIADVITQIKDDSAQSDEDWLRDLPWEPATQDDWKAHYNPAIKSRSFEIRPGGAWLEKWEGICALDISPCNRMIAAGMPGQVVIFDAKKGVVISSLKVRASDLYDDAIQLKFSPCSTYLAVSDADRDLKVWLVSSDAPHGIVRHNFQGHTSGIHSIAYATNGEFIATASFSRALETWNLRSSRRDLLISGQNDLTSVAISRDCRYIAAGFIDSLVRVYDAVTGSFLFRSSRCEGAVPSVKFTADGQYLAYACFDRNVYIWNYESWAQPPMMVKNHQDPIVRVASFCWGTLLSSGGDGSVHLIDIESRRVLACLKSRPNLETRVACSESSGIFVTFSKSNGAKIWSIEAIEPTTANHTPFGNWQSPATAGSGVGQDSVITPVLAPKQQLAQIPDLTEKQMRFMDTKDFPRNIIHSSFRGEHLPDTVKTWGHLKTWISRVQILPLDALEKIKCLQGLHMQALIKNANQTSSPAALAEKDGVSEPLQLPQVSSREIEYFRQTAPEQLRSLPEEQIRRFIFAKKIQIRQQKLAKSLPSPGTGT